MNPSEFDCTTEIIAYHYSHGHLERVRRHGAPQSAPTAPVSPSQAIPVMVSLREILQQLRETLEPAR